MGAAALTAFLLLGWVAGCSAAPDRAGTRWDEPPPTGKGAARLPQPGPGAGGAQQLPQPFGVKWNGYSYPAARYAPVISAYRGGGTFHDITWCAVERERGTVRWAVEDRVVDDILRYGLQPLIRIHIGSCWASGRAPSPTPRSSASHPPADPESYRAFVRTLVGRYAARGVHHYAIENEIDAENYWGADPAAYPAVARAGAAAVREADPNAVLLDPGLSSSSYGLAISHAHDGAGGSARQAEAVRFYQAFYARRGSSRLPRVRDLTALRGVYGTPAGRRILAAHAAVAEVDRTRVFDVYQLHYYDPWPLVPKVLEHIRSQIAPGLPIEAWEAGSFWPGGSYDPVRHAEETGKLAATLLAGGVRRIVYLPLFHSPGVIAPEERWRGLYTSGGTARPAAAAVDRLREATRSGHWQPIEELGPPGLAGAVVDQGGTTTLVIWSADGTPRTLHGPPSTDTSGATVTPLTTDSPRRWRDGDLRVSGAPLIISARAPVRAALHRLLEKTS